MGGASVPSPGQGQVSAALRDGHTSERNREAQIPQLPPGQESPGGGLPWEGASLLPPAITSQPPWGPQGIPREGGGKQVFVNSSCHMHEKCQAPAARSLATGKNKIKRPPQQSPPPPAARDPCPAHAGTRAESGCRAGARPCRRAPASSQDGFLSSEGRPCKAGSGLAPSCLGKHGLEGLAALRGKRALAEGCSPSGNGCSAGRGRSPTPKLGPTRPPWLR